jgi:hypothetical protein
MIRWLTEEEDAELGREHAEKMAAIRAAKRSGRAPKPSAVGLSTKKKKTLAEMDHERTNSAVSELRSGMIRVVDQTPQATANSPAFFGKVDRTYHVLSFDDSGHPTSEHVVSVALLVDRSRPPFPTECSCGCKDYGFRGYSGVVCKHIYAALYSTRVIPSGKSLL